MKKLIGKLFRFLSRRFRKRVMPLVSDIVIDNAKFSPNAISEQTTKANEHILRTFSGGPIWYQVGAARYREMRMNGETHSPPPRLLESAVDIELPSREDGRSITCRLIYPQGRESAEGRRACKGSILHIHGGGWVLGDHWSADNMLQQYANAGNLAVVSVGYRLAPEFPFPRGPEDCVDIAEYLVNNSFEEYGGPLRFIGGESAGAHLSLLTAIYLLKTRPEFHLSGLLLHFGCYDLSMLPSLQNYTKLLLLNRDLMEQFLIAFLPQLFPPQLVHDANLRPSLATQSTIPHSAKDPSISPYYEDLEPFRGRLPKALFTCGTDDPLIDDSVNMGVKWLMSGGEAVVKIYPGACHGFISIEEGLLEEAGKALRDTKAFIRECLEKA